MGPAKKKTNPVIPILIVVALIAVGVGAFVLLSGGDEAGDDPAATVEALFNADDCEAAGDLLSSATFDAIGGREAALQACQEQLDEQGGLIAAEGAELVSTEVTSEEESTATVAAEIRSPEGETTTTDYSLVKEDGEWKVDLSAGGGSGTTPPPSGEDGSGDGGGSGDTATSTPVEPPTSAPSDGGGSGGSGSLGEAGPIPSSDPTGTPEDFQNAEACSGGDMAACDELYAFTDIGSELETYGRTCGGRIGDESRTGGQCEEEFG